MAQCGIISEWAAFEDAWETICGPRYCSTSTTTWQREDTSRV